MQKKLLLQNNVESKIEVNKIQIKWNSTIMKWYHLILKTITN